MTQQWTSLSSDWQAMHSGNITIKELWGLKQKPRLTNV